MKSKIGHFILVIFGLQLLLVISSCSKDENDDDNNNNPPAATTVTDIDGNVYETIRIGTQVWMKENLKVTHYRNGIPINNVMDDSLWINLTTGAFCDYDNLADNSATYGKLYNWYAITDSRNICPNGWHIPSSDEWDILTEYLGGLNIAGNKLREAGTIHWESPNAGATNESGFTALPGGYRNSTIGIFDFIDGTGLWWSSSELNTTNAATRAMWYNSPSIGPGNFKKTLGASVRCVKDN